MILPVLQSPKYRLLLSHLCLTVALSSSFAPSLMASHNDPIIENEKKNFNRKREDSNSNDNSNEEKESLIENEPQSKRRKTDHASGALAMEERTEDIWWHTDAVSKIFFKLPFSSIRAGRCVSKAWNQLLMGDDFCTCYGQHFSPSTARTMKMTPQEFIHYWSTPSFTVLDNFVMNDGLLHMRADESIIVGQAHDGANDDKFTAVKWINGKTVPLPSLNNGSGVSAYGISADGSIIVGVAHDGANDDKFTAVKWINGEIMPLPFLNNGDDSAAYSISADGSIIVGHAYDGANDKSIAVKWINGKIMPLPFLNNEYYSAAHGISADGSIIVGWAQDANNKSTAVKWDNGEAFSIQALLESESLNLEEIHLDGADAVSANGLQVIVTSMLDGNECYFKAVLPSKYTQ